MSRKVERRKLKRSLLREQHRAEYDDHLTKLVEKAVEYDELMEEESSVCESDPKLGRTVSDPGSPSSFPHACSSFDSSSIQHANISEAEEDTSTSQDIQSCKISEVGGMSSSQLPQNLGETDCDAIVDYSSDEDVYFYHQSSDDDDDVLQSESELAVPESSASDLNSSLVHWAFSHTVTHAAMDDLLHILRDHGHESLPKKAVTLMKTPHSTSADIRTLGSGEFWYRGLMPALQLHFQSAMSNDKKEIEIDFFIDGISPYDKPSKNVHLWPIVGKIICGNKIRTQPFIIAMWCGSTKDPDCIDEFLSPFVDECEELMQGCILNGSKFKLVVRNSIADAPARALQKKVNVPNSTVCCERCEMRCSKVERRMVFPVGHQATARTDESFKLRSDPDYHKGTPSPLERIMNMVTQFPLEPLHLVDLGAMKRILKMLIEPKASKVYLMPSLRAKIDDCITVLPPYIPSEFKRKTKTLKFWCHLKGKELKRFLKYDGILVMWLLEDMRSSLQKGVYESFLYLSMGIRILSDPDLCSDYVEDADVLLNKFVESSVEVFGPHFNVFNIHHLTHLAAECKLHGPLENFDAYLYESFLGRVERLLHAPGRPLPQIIARTMERERHGYTGRAAIDETKFLIPHTKGPTDGLIGQSYAQFEKNFIINVNSSSDNCVLTKSRDVVIVENVVKDHDAVFFVGRSFLHKTSFFDSPLDSSLLNIFKVRTLGAVAHWPLCEVYRKCFLLPLDLKALPDMYKKGCLAIPFTHSTE